jgi:hypothetical protein
VLLTSSKRCGSRRPCISEPRPERHRVHGQAILVDEAGADQAVRDARAAEDDHVPPPQSMTPSLRATKPSSETDMSRISWRPRAGHDATR